MKAIVKHPGQAPQKIDINDGDTLSSLQALVDGLVTTVYVEGFDEAGITVWANDEGLLMRLTPNLLIEGQPIVGTVVFTGHNDEGETVGLTRYQMAAVERLLRASTLNLPTALWIAAKLASL